MFLKIGDFVQNWHHEAGSTQKIFDALTDESLAQEVSSEDRTLGRIAWHLVITLHEMMSRTGLRFEAPEDNAPVPASAKTIADTYRQTSAAMIAAIESQWTDASLLKESDMYGDSWPNGLTLSILISHQTHHRGQMTVLMRQAGLKVPGVYGPSRDEWSLMGAEPPAL